MMQMQRVTEVGYPGLEDICALHYKSCKMIEDGGGWYY